MKYCISLLLAIVASTPICAQNIVKMSAIKANNYGVTYSLPKTSIAVTVEYTKTTRKTGEFYKYAEMYLNINNPITENKELYSLDKLEASPYGVIDKESSYLVEFKSNSTAPYVSLTKDGLICAINDDYAFPKAEAQQSDQNIVTEPLLDPSTFLSEEILRAGSTAKQAELIAKQIYRLRESRNNILTGEADNMPPDGQAYKIVMGQLEAQERSLTAMFIGTETKEKGEKTFNIIPDNKNIDNRIIFRFSSKLGVVESNDLAGAPVYFSLKNKNPLPEQILTPKEEKEMEKKFSRGIIYNVPNKASITLSHEGKNYVQKDIDVVQFGKQDVLTPQMFDNNKKPVKVIFYPELGAIKQIIE